MLSLKKIKVKRIAITGGIGVGKTKVSELFHDLGVPVYNSDVSAKELMASDPKVTAAIKSLFGEKAYRSNGFLNKAYIANEIFSDPLKRTALNAIVHPAVRAHFTSWLANQDPNTNYILYESALVFENNLESNFDAVILVTASRETRIARVCKRDLKSEQQVLAIMNAQSPEEAHLDKADFVLKNQDLATTVLKVKELHKNISYM